MERRTSMQLLLSWLMVFSVLAGLSARVPGIHQDHAMPSAFLTEDHCCQHNHDNSPGSHPGEERKCPPDHQHHGCCCVVMPLAVDHPAICRMEISELNVFGMLHEGDRPPEEPLLSSEKPPLI